MTRRMADSIELASLPPGFDIYGGYDDGNWPDADSIAAQFPGKTVIRITTDPNDNEGDCLDVESGDARPQDAPGWVAERRAAGHKGPLVYCSESIWLVVRLAFQNADVPEPGFWVAAYPGEGAVIPAGAIAHQWIDRGPYDESVVVDYLPGIDPAPPISTSPPALKEADMASPLAVGRNDSGVAVDMEFIDAGGHVIQVTWDGSKWVIFDHTAGTAPPGTNFPVAATT